MEGVFQKFQSIVTTFDEKYEMATRFYEQEVKAGLKDKRKLAAYLETVVREHLKDVKLMHLNYIFCTDEFLIGINLQYLQHDTFTDIITFDLSENIYELQGEIYISVERAKENAKQFGVDYRHELLRVIFHGVLHLCGFKDKKKEDEEVMRKMEEACIREYGEFQLPPKTA